MDVQILMDVINKIIAMPPPTNKKETLAFFRCFRFLEKSYSRLQSDCKHSQVTQKKTDFKVGPEQ